MLEYVLAALDIAGLSSTDKLLLIQLARRTDTYGRARGYTVNQLAQACAVTDRTVQTGLRWLESNGYIAIRRATSGPSSYTLALNVMRAPKRRP